MFRRRSKNRSAESSNPFVGVIGAGDHETVARSARSWLLLTEEMLDLLPSDSDSTLPPAEHVALRALTYEGRRSITALEADLGYERHPASPLFHAAHNVIYELRRIDERNG